VGDIELGGVAVEVSAGNGHSCARLDTGAIRCWGRNFYGQLGYANTIDIGDDESPASAGDVQSN
jgi:alpha-tubulin suppressor-like RCC1 family protein